MEAKSVTGLSIAEQKKSAMDKVLRTVNLSETSTMKMRAKLEARGFHAEVIEDTIVRAQECSLIDDMRYADCLVRSALSLNKGLAKVEQELRALDIDINDVASYIEFSESSEKSERDMALEVLRSKPPKAKDKRSAAYRKLVSKGYSSDIASEVARIWYEECPCCEC